MFGKLKTILGGKASGGNDSRGDTAVPVPAAAAAHHAAADALIAEGNRAEQANDLPRACELYRQAVAVAPRYAPAHLNLGIGLEATGDVAGAAGAYEAALAIAPDDAAASYNLGRLHFAAGRPERAEPLLRRSLAANPRFPDARIVLAAILELRNDLPAAATELEAALRDRPDYFGALNNYADVLLKLDRKADAAAALRKALALQPRDYGLNKQLGQLLLEGGQAAEAEVFLRNALKAQPESVDVLALLVNLHLGRGELKQAAEAAEAALLLRPTWPELLFNFGLIARRQNRHAEAEVALRRVISLKPDFAQAYQVLASAMVSQCRLEDALEALAEGRKRCSEADTLESAELFAMNYLEETTPGELFARHVDYGKRLEAREPAAFDFADRDRDPQRRLRIGFVSPDFKAHVVPQFLLPLLEERDRTVVEIHCYSTGDSEDEVSARLKAQSDTWTAAGRMDTHALAQKIHAHGIDILVDLAGHSSVPTLPVFARKPAPVQVTWLGYLNTTGLTRIDYRLSDHFSDPPGMTDGCHTEKLFRLPDSQWCYRPFVEVDFEKETPARRNGHVTFGSFNQAMKTMGPVRDLWAQILKRVPGSKLLAVGFADDGAREAFLKELEQAGVARERITVLPYVRNDEYFRLYGKVDIALDTTPFSGGTTTFDALWMGVPVLTLPGPRPWSRSASSVLTNLGMGEWVAQSPQDYVERALRFASDSGALATLRTSLRGRLQSSAMMDGKRFARNMESAWRQMWQTWCGLGGG